MEVKPNPNLTDNCDRLVLRQNLKLMLLKNLQAAIASVSLPLPEIPLQRSKNSLRVEYLSPIALKLANMQPQSPMDMALKIATYCQEDRQNQRYLNQEYLTIEVVPPGIVLFQLTDLAVAASLQNFPGLIKQKMEKSDLKITHLSVDNDRLFPIQYSHARCCSLLRLADRERIIEIADGDRTNSQPLWQLIAPNPIPWLDDQNRLRLFHPAELNLISQLFIIIDYLAPFLPENSEDLIIANRAENWDKLAKALSDVFQTFYSQCRIWGEVKQETPKLAQARLGLVVATQALLQFILQELLGVFAPLEL
jgi:arginyl-tRNA synthetase